MFERIRNGWELTKASWRTLSANRELLVFPLVSAFAALLVTLSFVVPIVATQAWQMFDQGDGGKVAAGVVIWLFYFVTSAVGIYFNTALVGAALMSLEGKDPTLGDGLRVANARIGAIAGYAAISATVGLVLSAARNRGGKVQQWVSSLAGVAWSLATFLVVPVLAASGVGPIAAIKKSASLLRKTWGEQLVGVGGIKVIAGLGVFGLLLLGVPATVVTAAEVGPEVAIAVGALFVLALVALVLVTSALQAVYTAAVYRYATTGEGGLGFGREQLAGAFRVR
jgi:hypothetical protein